MPTDKNNPSSQPDRKDEKVRDLPERKVATEKEEQVKGGSGTRRPVFDQE